MEEYIDKDKWGSHIQCRLIISTVQFRTFLEGCILLNNIRDSSLLNIYELPRKGQGKVVSFASEHFVHPLSGIILRKDTADKYIGYEKRIRRVPKPTGMS